MSWGEFHRGQLSRGGSCPEGNYFGVIFRAIKVREVILLAGNFMGGHCPEGSCPGGGGGRRNVRIPFICSSLLYKCTGDSCRSKYNTHFSIFDSVWKEEIHKPSKIAAAKNFFSSVYVTGTTDFDEWFLLNVITWKHYFL